jgi:hypothetical protein
MLVFVVGQDVIPSEKFEMAGSFVLVVMSVKVMPL